MFGHDLSEICLSLLKMGEVHHTDNITQLKDYLDSNKKILLLADIAFVSIDQDEINLNQCIRLIRQYTHPGCCYIGVTKGNVESQIQKAVKFGLKDLYHTSEDPLHIVRRIDFIKNLDDQFVESVDNDVNVLNAEISL